MNRLEFAEDDKRYAIVLDYLVGKTFVYAYDNDYIQKEYGGDVEYWLIEEKEYHSDCYYMDSDTAIIELYDD